MDTKTRQALEGTFDELIAALQAKRERIAAARATLAEAAADMRIESARAAAANKAREGVRS